MERGVVRPHYALEGQGNAPLQLTHSGVPSEGRARIVQ